MWRIETARQLAQGQRAAVDELIATTGAANGFRPLSDQLWLDLVHGGRPGFGAVMAVIDQRLAGYAQLGLANGSWTIEVVVHPDDVAAYTELATAVLEGALDVVRASGGGQVSWWAFRADDRAAGVAASVGLQPSRDLQQLRRPLPIAETTAVPTRAFRVGEDEAAWLEVNNAAFAWHPEQGGWDLSTLQQREEEPWFDPEGFRVHDRDGAMAAFCWTKVHTGTPDGVLGEIYVIAVHPRFHGLGLGKALTIAGLTSLSARGVTHGMLHVDTDNTAALTLYQHLGFTTHHVDRAFTGDVPATPEANDDIHH